MLIIPCSFIPEGLFVEEFNKIAIHHRGEKLEETCKSFGLLQHLDFVPRGKIEVLVHARKRLHN